MGQIIDGKALANEVQQRLKQRVCHIEKQGTRPGLAVVLVGDDPASAVYVRNKTRACGRIGIEHFDYKLPASTTHQELIALIGALNSDARVHGILVQLPLPPHINSAEILTAVAPHKDADGFHPINLGHLMAGNPTVVPCTPLGVIAMLKHTGIALQGASALVVGRSTIVGKPLAHLLLAEHCTVTVAHSRSRDLAELVRRADVLVAAVGRAQLIKGDWIKEGAVVIDVGTNRVGDRLVGDVEFDRAKERASAISPVPGGVGPMTIAMLLANTVRAAERSCSI